MEVIKGPAAATLYGAEAASGVIQIITKKGRPAEGLQWTANFKYGRIDWAPGNKRRGSVRSSTVPFSKPDW
ncbi:MAG: hypothetical protein LOD92_09800 [Bacillales bacterium]